MKNLTLTKKGKRSRIDSTVRGGQICRNDDDLPVRSRIVEDIVDPAHLGKDSPVTQGVAECRKPWSDVTQHRHCSGVGGRNNVEANVEVENDGSSSDQVVEVRTAEANQPKGKTYQ